MSATKEISLKEQLYCPIPTLHTCSDCGNIVGYKADHSGELLRDNDGRPIPSESEVCRMCDQNNLSTSSILDETNSLMHQIFER